MISRWVMEQSGSISVDRAEPAPSSIKSAIDVLRRGEVMLIFPSGTRNSDISTFKRGAATIALHAQVAIVPAFYDGPKEMHVAHLVGRPRIQVSFGQAIPTAGLRIDKATACALTQRLHAAIERLGSTAHIYADAA